jgi:methyl-accepting chemotaxis protein
MQHQTYYKGFAPMPALRQLSIQWKITLLAGLCLASIVTLLVGLSLYRMDHSSDLVKASSMHMLTEAAQSRIESQGEVQALNIRRQFMDAYQYGAGFARQVLFLREQAEKRFLDAFDLREDMTRQVRAALQANPDLLGLSLVFEPNALDGKDKLFAGQAELGSNETGRFALYWSQPRAGQLTSMALPEHDMANTESAPAASRPTPGGCAHAHRQGVRGRALLLRHRRPAVLMTSIVFPLTVNGKVIATLSIDINLNSLQALSQSASRSLYEGRTTVGILSPVGLLAGYSADASKLAQRLDQVDTAKAPSWCASWPKASCRSCMVRSA